MIRRGLMDSQQRRGSIPLGIFLAGIFFVLLIITLFALRNQAKASEKLSDEVVALRTEADQSGFHLVGAETQAKVKAGRVRKVTSQDKLMTFDVPDDKHIDVSYDKPYTVVSYKDSKINAKAYLLPNPGGWIKPDFSNVPRNNVSKTNRILTARNIPVLELWMNDGSYAAYIASQPYVIVNTPSYVQLSKVLPTIIESITVTTEDEK